MSLITFCNVKLSVSTRQTNLALIISSLPYNQIYQYHFILTMSFQNSERLRALTRSLLEEVTNPVPVRHQAAPIFSNFPWLPTPFPTASPTNEEPWELLADVPTELPAEVLPKPNKVVYADVWLTDNAPYSLSTPSSPTLSIRSCNSSNSSNTSESTSVFSSSSSSISSLSSASHISRRPQNLRRKKSPQQQSLRQLRTKASEADLQKLYDQQTKAYVHELFSVLGSPIKSKLPVIPE